VGSGLGCFPLFIPSYFIPIYARAVASQRVAVIILAMWNVASTVGRVLAGFLADTILGPLNSLILSLLLAGVSALAIWPFANSVAVLSVFILLNGLGCGAFFSLIPAAVGSMFGAKNTMGVLPILWAGWFFGYFFVRLSRIVILSTSSRLSANKSHTGFADSRWDLFLVRQGCWHCCLPTGRLLCGRHIHRWSFVCGCNPLPVFPQTLRSSMRDTSKLVG
jgi:MFS family permease